MKSTGMTMIDRYGEDLNARAQEISQDVEYYVGHEPPPIKRTTALCLLKELVAALDETHWSSWQSTARFDSQLTHARSFLAELEG